MCTYIESFFLCFVHIVRLAGGSSCNQGRVEVYHNGEWGTVCNAGWDHTDATVVCRQLGLGVSGSAAYYNNFERGSGYILLSNVMCSSDDYTLAACGHFGVGIIGYCGHNSEAGVICEYYGMCFIMNTSQVIYIDECPSSTVNSATIYAAITYSTSGMYNSM